MLKKFVQVFVISVFFAIPSVVLSQEVISFDDLMSLMEKKDITYTGSSHDDRPMKVTKENGKWQMEQTEAGKVSGIVPNGKNRIKMDDYPSNWIINGTWEFSKSGDKCQIAHLTESFLTMYWKCGAPVVTSAKNKSEVFSFVHTDPEWKGGKGDVPEKGICLKHNGKSLSPSLKISGIPGAAKSIRLMFTDADYGSEGGHGDFSVKLNRKTTIEIPPIDGDKDYLPANITSGNGHHCDSCSEGDYLGPCSGGRGHTYRVNIYARDAEQEILAKGTILLGNF